MGHERGRVRRNGAGSLRFFILLTTACCLAPGCTLTCAACVALSAGNQGEDPPFELDPAHGVEAEAVHPREVFVKWALPIETPDGEGEFLILRRIDEGGFEEIGRASGLATSWRDTTAEPSTTYEYHVQAVWEDQMPEGGTDRATVTTPADGGPGGWSFLVVDDSLDADASLGYGIRLALASGGVPHVIYIEGERSGIYTVPRELRHATFDDVRWHVGSVSGDVVEGSFGLVLDSGDRPHAAWMTETDGVFMYGRDDGTGWAVEEVALPQDEPEEVTALALAIDSDDRLHVAVSSFLHGESDLVHGVLEAGAWAFETVRTTRCGIEASDLAVDSAGDPHVLTRVDETTCSEYTDHGPVLEIREGTEWRREAITGSNDDGHLGRLVLDSEDEPHVAFYSLVSMWISYATRQDGSWVVEPLVSLDARLRELDIALDPEGRPAIAYSGGFLRGTADGWIPAGDWIQTFRGESTSVACDGEGRWHVALGDRGNTPAYGEAGDPLYGWWDPEIEPWIREEPPGAGTGTFPSIAEGRYGTLHVTDAHFSSAFAPEIRHLVDDGDSWTAFGHDDIGEVAEVPVVLALDPEDRAHVVFEGDGLSHGLLDGPDVTVTGIAAEYVLEGEDEGPAVAVTPDGVVHVVFHCSTNRDLVHAWLDGGEWRLETVDSAGDVGRDPAVAAGPDGALHVSYRDATGDLLRHAVLGTGGWTLETVDDTAGAGRWSDIAVGPDGLAHVSYAIAVEDTWEGEASAWPVELRHARETASGWSVETVLASGYTGAGTRIAVAPDGTVHILHQDLWRRELRHSWQVDGGWDHEMVVAPRCFAGTHFDLLVDEGGRVHVVYDNLWETSVGTTGVLTYARKHL